MTPVFPHGAYHIGENRAPPPHFLAVRSLMLAAYRLRDLFADHGSRSKACLFAYMSETRAACANAQTGSEIGRKRGRRRATGRLTLVDNAEDCP
mgnify:CR=1 FL=1